MKEKKKILMAYTVSSMEEAVKLVEKNRVSGCRPNIRETAEGRFQVRFFESDGFLRLQNKPFEERERLK